MFSYRRNLHYYIDHYAKNIPLQVHNSCKRTFLCISPWDGALTVEAALVLPLFLFAMMGILTIGRWMCVDMKIAYGLVETGKDMASEHLENAGILTIGAKMKHYLGDDLPDISYLGSYYEEEEECYYLTAQYEGEVTMPLIGAITIPFTQTVKQRAFTGFDWKQGQWLNEDDAYVYVTDTGGVYHTKRECTHVLLSVQIRLDMQPSASWRSEYKPCERCTKQHTGAISQVYVTNYGDKYHTSIGCSGLKRTVTRIRKSELKGMRQCQRCGAEVS
jgi:hypothetical protein